MGCHTQCNCTGGGLLTWKSPKSVVILTSSQTIHILNYGPFDLFESYTRAKLFK